MIGDDGLLLEARKSRLLAHPHPNTRGLLEIRNIGLVTFPVCDEAPVALVIRLDESAQRFTETADQITLAGIAVPMLRLWPGSPVIHLRAEQALERFGQG